MNTPDHYTGTAEQDISSAVTGVHDFAETIQSAGVYPLLAVAAAINRLADAVSEAGTVLTFDRLSLPRGEGRRVRVVSVSACPGLGALRIVLDVA
jgi:hypothetical protein